MAWVPLPWWASQSSTATRSTPAARACPAATAAWFTRQKPIARAALGVVAGRPAEAERGPEVARQHGVDRRGRRARRDHRSVVAPLAHDRVEVDRPSPALAELADARQEFRRMDALEILRAPPARASSTGASVARTACMTASVRAGRSGCGPGSCSRKRSDT